MYLIVGLNDEVEEKRLDGIVRKHLIDRFIVLTGYIIDAELAKRYCLADIYEMPNKKKAL